MEKHFCDLETCEKEIATTHRLELRSINVELQKRYDLTGANRNEFGKYTFLEFCSEDCLIDFTINRIKDARGYLNGMGKQLKSLELIF